LRAAQHVDLLDVEEPGLNETHGRDDHTVILEGHCGIEGRRNVRRADPAQAELTARTRTADLDIQGRHAAGEIRYLVDAVTLERLTADRGYGDGDFLERFVLAAGLHDDHRGFFGGRDLFGRILSEGGGWHRGKTAQRGTAQQRAAHRARVGARCNSGTKCVHGPLSPSGRGSPAHLAFSPTTGRVSPHAFGYGWKVYGAAPQAPSAKAIVTLSNCDKNVTCPRETSMP